MDFPIQRNWNEHFSQSELPTLSSYNFLIGLDWYGQHLAKVSWYNKRFICLNERRSKTKIQDIQGETQVRWITTNWLKENERKGWHHGTMHVRSENTKNEQQLGDYVIQKKKIQGRISW